MTYQTGVAAQSQPVELPEGVGAVAISNAAGLSCEIRLSIGEDIYVGLEDGAAITDDALVPIDIGAPCWVRVDVSAGSCDIQVAEKVRRQMPDRSTTVIIRPATLRDVSYVAANMRPEDHAEITCQVPPDTRPVAIAKSSLAAGEARVVFRYGLPCGAFGFVPVSEGVLSAWAFGRPGFERCIPAITRHVYREFVGSWLKGNIRRIEARTIESHTSAHRWLEKAGAARCCALEQWGRNGERFFLYEWVRGRVPEQTYRRWGHVLQHQRRNARHATGTGGSQRQCQSARRGAPAPPQGTRLPGKHLHIGTGGQQLRLPCLQRPQW